MNEAPPDDSVPDEIGELYRRAAALDPSRPSESARRSILDEAARVAALRAAQARPIDIQTARRASRRAWVPALIGTLAAALFAGLVVVPRLWTPPAPRQSDLVNSAAEPAANLGYSSDAPSPVPAPAAAPGPAPAALPPPRLSEVAPASRASRSAALRRTENAPVSQSDALDAIMPAAPAAPAAPSPAPAPPPLLAQSSRQARPESAFLGSSAVLLARARQSTDAEAALRRAAQAGDILALNHALTAPVDVNARDESGRSALMLAILNGQGGAVEALLAHGADPNAADAKGMTPLAAAVSRADPSIIAQLQRAGASTPQ